MPLEERERKLRNRDEEIITTSTTQLQVENEKAGLDPWYLENLVCPVDKSSLRLENAFLVSESGRRYPVVEGMPVMLLGDVKETIGVARTSFDVANAVANGENANSSPLYVETLGITDAERAIARDIHDAGGPYDPVVATMVGATSGIAYKHLIGSQISYPIPVFRFPAHPPGRLLDVGCNWGRWTIAGGREGYDAVGIDPQLGAILAARRVAAQLGVKVRFVVGDARYLPFRADQFDKVWSYSVLQHFSREDARAALKEIGRICRTDATVRVQMANAFGIRSLYHMARRGFRAPAGFDVRYWSPAELRNTFARIFGTNRLDADCYLGLGLQWSDYSRMSPTGKTALLVSEGLRRLSEVVPPIRWFADSLFCTACARQKNG